MSNYSILSIPYDVWVAAHLFMNTGVDSKEVLNCINVSQEDWDRLDQFFSQLQYAYNTTFMLGDAVYNSRDYEFFKFVMGRDFKPELKSKEVALPEELKKIRDVVRANPYAGPFSDRPWQAFYIADHYHSTGVIYSRNEKDVFFNGKKLCDKNGHPLSDINAKKFHLIGRRWMTDGERVYAQGQSGSKQALDYFYPVEGADVLTFKALNEKYAVDKNAAYYITNKRIKIPDTSSFSVITYKHADTSGEVREVFEASAYAKDSKNVFHCGKKLSEANPESFHQVITNDVCNGEYFADKEHVWFEGKLIKNADPKTFMVAHENLVYQHAATDGHRPYWREMGQTEKRFKDPWDSFFNHRPDLKGYWWHKKQRD